MDLQSIEKKIKRIRPLRFYWILMVFFAFIGGMHFFYGIYHNKVVMYTALAGIWIVVAVAIYTNGYMANTYKDIIDSLLSELRKTGNFEEKDDNDSTNGKQPQITSSKEK